MAIRKRRISRHATRRLSQRGRGKWLKTIGIPLLGILLVVTVALVWGSYLKAKSDALADAQERGEWTLDVDASPVVPLTNPTLVAGYARPGGNIQKTQDTTYTGVTIPLGSCDAPLPYTLELPTTLSGDTGISFASGAPALANHVASLKAKGLYVVGVFDVTCFDTADAATRTYRKGLEMTLISLFVKAGVNDILLTGLPVGNDYAETLSTQYLKDIRSLFTAGASTVTPALGVTLSPTAFVGDETAEDGSPIYAGSLTPGRLLSACDYLVLDVRGQGAYLDETLQNMQYAYVRYNLRLLMSNNDASLISKTAKHGFTRIWEYGR